MLKLVVSVRANRPVFGELATRGVSPAPFEGVVGGALLHAPLCFDQGVLVRDPPHPVLYCEAAATVQLRQRRRLLQPPRASELNAAREGPSLRLVRRGRLAPGPTLEAGLFGLPRIRPTLQSLQLAPEAQQLFLERAILMKQGVLPVQRAVPLCVAALEFFAGFSQRPLELLGFPLPTGRVVAFGRVRQAGLGQARSEPGVVQLASHVFCLQLQDFFFGDEFDDAGLRRFGFLLGFPGSGAGT